MHERIAGAHGERSVVRVLEVQEDVDVVGIGQCDVVVMEFLTGSTVRERCVSYELLLTLASQLEELIMERMPEAVALTIAHGLFTSMATAHSMGVAHR